MSFPSLPGGQRPATREEVCENFNSCRSNKNMLRLHNIFHKTEIDFELALCKLPTSDSDDNHRSDIHDQIDEEFISIEKAMANVLICF